MAKNNKNDQTEGQEYYLEGYYDSSYSHYESGKEAEPDEVKPPRQRMSRGRLVILTVLMIMVAAILFFIIRFTVDHEMVVSNNDGNFSICFIRTYKQSPGQDQPNENFVDAIIPSMAPAAQQSDVDHYGAAKLYINRSKAEGQLNNQQIFNMCSESLVSVENNVEGESRYSSGVIMSADGYIITSYSAVAGASELAVTTCNGKTYPATVVGVDEATELAVLSIEARGLTPAVFGDSESVEVGEPLVALGVLAGGACCLTDGLASAVDSNIVVNGIPTSLILTNATVSSWNTGGPLVNRFGQVIAILDMDLADVYGEDNVLACAIPVSIAKPIIDELLEKGYVSGRPAMGVSMADIPATMSAYLGIPKGVMIGSVSVNSDAYEKGLSRGDIIVSANDTVVEGTDDLNRVKNSLSVGDTIQLGVWRNGTVYYIDVLLHDSSEGR